jgi:hypothetical protein
MIGPRYATITSTVCELDSRERSELLSAQSIEGEIQRAISNHGVWE